MPLPLHNVWNNVLLERGCRVALSGEITLLRFTNTPVEHGLEEKSQVHACALQSSLASFVASPSLCQSCQSCVL